MSTATSERRLVDREFQPDELPAGDAMPVSLPSADAPTMTGRPIGLGVRLAAAAVAALLGLYLVDASIELANRAIGGNLRAIWKFDRTMSTVQAPADNHPAS